MPDPTGRRLKVLLCGTNHGAWYVPAIEQGGSSFELGGILAQGSARSVALAEKKNVPLWTSIERVPHGFDVAVTALRSPVAESVAETLVQRKVHLLVEHPVAAEALAGIRGAAKAAKLVHHVNCHFAEFNAARAFVAECRRRTEARPVHYVSVVTAARAAYATFDLLGRALGGLSGAWLERERGPASREVQYPFESFLGVISGVSVRLQCSQAVASVDDGSDSPVPQRIEIGFEDGNLIMLSPAGPVVWTEKLRLELRDSKAPLWNNVAKEAGTFADLLADRVNANRRSLDEFHRQIAGGPEPAHQSTQWLSTIAELTRTVRGS